MDSITYETEHEGCCPKCGSYDVRYVDADYDDNLKTEHYVCNGCAIKYEEYFEELVEYNYTGSYASEEVAGAPKINIEVIE